MPIWRKCRIRHDRTRPAAPYFLQHQAERRADGIVGQFSPDRSTPPCQPASQPASQRMLRHDDGPPLRDRHLDGHVVHFHVGCPCPSLSQHCWRARQVHCRRAAASSFAEMSAEHLRHQCRSASRIDELQDIATTILVAIFATTGIVGRTDIVHARGLRLSGTHQRQAVVAAR